MRLRTCVWLFFFGVTLNCLVQSIKADDLDLEDTMMNGIDDDLDFPEEKSEDPELTTTTTTPEPLVKVETVPYTKPSIEGLQFAETFDDNIFNRWIKSANEKFSGEWSQALRSLEAIEGDKGLKVMNEARHHGIAAKMPEAMIKNKGKAVVVSYEAKFEEGLNCGGAYIKLFHTSNLTSKGSKMSEFDNETPYSVMFGPDHCGTTNKVHFIIKQFNPISKEWVEHHLADPPRVPQGKLTHVYSFIVKPNNTYEVLVDGAVSKSGDMNADFEPPFTPPKQIDDPTDSKPSDWVDEERIDDPDAVKPEDWDEDAPREIPDAKAVMPEGWLENEEQMIGDANTRQPEDWDTEEDGEWSAPLIKNPACISVPGCGKWKAPMIPNPDFKGKWYPPMIPNPAFKGIWTPKQIDNPNYFVSENPHALPDFNAIGFELWTMQKSLLFDNIVVARSMDPVKSFIEKTWNVRHDIEAAQEKAATHELPVEAGGKIGKFEKVFAGAMIFATNHPAVFGVGLATFVLVSVMLMLKTFKSAPEPVRIPPTKTAKKSKDSEGEEEEEQDEAEGEELKDGEKEKSARQRKARKD